MTIFRTSSCLLSASPRLLVSTLAMLTLMLGGCLNMPTPTSQITGTYTSGAEYKPLSCSELTRELDSLSRRENALVVAQEQRIKSSKVQGFWYGVGSGDGMEASELGDIRGKIEAVTTIMQEKGCK